MIVRVAVYRRTSRKEAESRGSGWEEMDEVVREPSGFIVVVVID